MQEAKLFYDTPPETITRLLTVLPYEQKVYCATVCTVKMKGHPDWITPLVATEQGIILDYWKTRKSRNSEDLNPKFLTWANDINDIKITNQKIEIEILVKNILKFILLKKDLERKKDYEARFTQFKQCILELYSNKPHDVPVNRS